MSKQNPAKNYLYDFSINPGSGHFEYAKDAFIPQNYDKYTHDASNSYDRGILERQRKAFAIPASLSSARQGFAHHTFLGASVRNVKINGGFGDTASTLSIDLVEDEFNKSDGKPLGAGADPYHNGVRDTFYPPVPGSPVFFNFGTSLVSVLDSYRKMYDDSYRAEILSYMKPKDQANYRPNHLDFPGGNHFNFGGILQSTTLNRGQEGNPVYSAQVVDPREVLSNVELILNNYTGSTFNNKNMFNIYGFLEFNPTRKLRKQMYDFDSGFGGVYSVASILKKVISPDGSYYFDGWDMMANSDQVFDSLGIYNPNIDYQGGNEGFPARMPITGTGFSRRGPQGIPYYRIRQAISSLLSVDGALPAEYVAAGFGGYINFRGYNYIVDLNGLKSIPPYYFFDFDKINLLDFCLEVCDISSSDLFVSLFPIINHPVSQRFYEYNNRMIEENTPHKMVAGIIKVDTIDRSFQPAVGVIREYIDDVNATMPVTNADLGYELSNVVTDKFVAGAQKVDMYFFSGYADRDSLEIRKKSRGQSNTSAALNASQWQLEESLSQQILPFYGFLGKECVTIPKGFGAYQQIMLDSSSWGVNGIGNYYIATEMELRAALISYERWSDFLMQYNDVYMESLEANDAVEGAALSQSPPPPGFPSFIGSLSQNFAVTVPRSVFSSDNNFYGTDGLPLNACNPPYGYPLYYKRATRLGVQGAGLTDISATTNKLITSLAEIRGAAEDGVRLQETLNSTWKDIEYSMGGNLSGLEADYVDFIKDLFYQNRNNSTANVIGLIDQFANGLVGVVKATNRLAKKTSENSLKAYNFIKKIADDNLGKKFLIKMPKRVNLNYQPIIATDPRTGEIARGPFGFPPQPINSNPLYGSSPLFANLLQQQAGMFASMFSSPMKSYLESDKKLQVKLMMQNPLHESYNGAIDVNYNPVVDQLEYNYTPSRQGGYVEYDLFSRISQQSIDPGVSQGLFPQDLTNFIQDNNRLSAYVRYDHSEDLAFDLLSDDSFTQQVMVAGHFIPDVSDVLDNTKTEENKFKRFPSTNALAQEPPRPQTIGFVKCDIDEVFYLPPPTVWKVMQVHGFQVNDIGQYSMPVRVFDDQQCEYVSGFRYYKPHYVPKPNYFNGPQRLDFVRDATGRIVTRKDYLDTDHIYALITLPGRVVPVADKRFRDGIFQEKNAQYIKHFLTQDVVKIPEFESPAYTGKESNALSSIGSALDPGAVGGAIAAFQKALDGLDFAFPNRINTAMPSPVYPDLVAIPLESRERCYGPWISSVLDGKAAVYSNIGGKIEFLKDENLAPWNFNGYDLMNEAGTLQAQFSNSLLLTSERGSFTYAGAPSGISLGGFLKNAGPLITSVSIDIGTGGVKTSCQMDLYTSSFGKLQKQKQDMISNISRERQKLKDERNSLIRKGLGKSQKNINYNLIYQQIKNQRVIPQAAGSSYMPYGNIVGQANSQDTNSTISGGSSLFGAVGDPATVKRTSYSASVGDGEKTANLIGDFPDRGSASKAFYNAASTNINEMFLPASMEPGHPNMSYRDDPFSESRAEYYS